YIWPTTGELSVLGNQFGKVDIHQLRKTIGRISSSLGERINGRHTVVEIVVSGRFAYVGLVFEETKAGDFEKASELMTLLGIDYTYGRPYEKCSQGEKQKILIARGLMAEPELLILDEPTTGLDFIAKEDLLQTIEEIAKAED